MYPKLIYQLWRVKMIIKDEKENSPKLMIIPMIDIIFFLLVFFMMAMISMSYKSSIDVNLPSASSSQNINTKNISITVTKDGAIYYGNDNVDMDTLVAILKREQENGEISILIMGDEGANYGKVVSIIDAIKNSGIEKISIATVEKEPAS